MEKALAIANHLIMLGVERGIPPTQMKLQKLVYFAHGWHLALYDEPLVEETFQAWKYGPVIPSLYGTFRSWGITPINRAGAVPAVTVDDEINWLAPIISAGAVDRLFPFLKRIQDVYGRWNGTQLSSLTHKPDTPWSQVRKGHPEDARDIEIPNDLIQAYFKGKLHA